MRKTTRRNGRAMRKRRRRGRRRRLRKLLEEGKAVDKGVCEAATPPSPLRLGR